MLRANNAVQVTTGNVRTTIDDTQKVPLGTPYIDHTNGVKYRYVKFDPTLLPAIQAAPAGVWWKDAAKTKVTPTKAESWNGAADSFAGFLMPNSTDVAGLTTAALKDKFVFIAVAGVVSAVAHAADAAGGRLMGAPADWTTAAGTTHVDTGVAATDMVVAYAKGATPSDINVVVESL